MDTEYVALIPSYKPDKRLISTAKELLSSGFQNIVIVNDGSGAQFEQIFDSVRNLQGVFVVSHSVNMGKGRALKTGFNYILEHFPGAAAVSVDGDGQHRAIDALEAIKLSKQFPDCLILGCRDFKNTENMPLPNFLGNVITRVTVLLLTGIWFSDTQCGLRGYPPEVMQKLIAVPGERFEFESNTLLYVKSSKLKCVEFPISVIYEEKGEYITTYRRKTDSVKIYKSLLKILISPLLCLLISSVAMLLLPANPDSPLVSGILYGLFAFLGFSACSLSVKNKLLCFFTGVIFSALFGFFSFLLFNTGFSPERVYFTLIRPGILIGYILYMLSGFGKNPKIIRIK